MWNIVSNVVAFLENPELYFDAVLLFVIKPLLLFRLALVILCRLYPTDPIARYVK